MTATSMDTKEGEGIVSNFEAALAAEIEAVALAEARASEGAAAQLRALEEARWELEVLTERLARLKQMACTYPLGVIRNAEAPPVLAAPGPEPDGEGDALTAAIDASETWSDAMLVVVRQQPLRSWSASEVYAALREHGYWDGLSEMRASLEWLSTGDESPLEHEWRDLGKPGATRAYRKRGSLPAQPEPEEPGNGHDAVLAAVLAARPTCRRAVAAVLQSSLGVWMLLEEVVVVLDYYGYVLSNGARPDASTVGSSLSAAAYENKLPVEKIRRKNGRVCYRVPEVVVFPGAA